MIKLFKNNWKVLVWIAFPFFYFLNNKLGYIENFFNMFNKVIIFSTVIFSFVMLSNIRQLKSYSISIIFSFLSHILTLYIIIKIIIIINENYIYLQIEPEYIIYNVILSIFLILFTLLIALHNHNFIDLNIRDNVYTYINSDQYRTTVHEVGHLVCYGLLKNSPSIKVKIIDTKNSFFVKEYLGYVERSEDFEPQRNKALLEWEMMMLLSGKELEKFIIGDSGPGSKGDFKKWKNIASEYLSLGFGEIYYDNPINSYEKELNHITLSNLKREQEKNILVFFEYNHQKIKNIIDVLYESKELNDIQIKEIFDEGIKETLKIKKIEYI